MNYTQHWLHTNIKSFIVKKARKHTYKQNIWQKDKIRDIGETHFMQLWLDNAVFMYKPLKFNS